MYSQKQKDIALAAASLIPGADTIADILAIPVDLARGDLLSAGLDLFGAIPVFGEIADAAKLAGKVDDAIDVARAAKVVGNGKSIMKVSNKSLALKNVDKLPGDIQKSAKSFFKRGSGKYNDFAVIKNKDKTYTMMMEKPGEVPGSKAVYYKVVDENGDLIKAYKDTFDPKGNFVHRKDKS